MKGLRNGLELPFTESSDATSKIEGNPDLAHKGLLLEALEANKTSIAESPVAPSPAQLAASPHQQNSGWIEALPTEQGLPQQGRDFDARKFSPAPASLSVQRCRTTLC